MGNIFHVIKGPRLFRIFHSNAEAGRNYEPKLLESGADKVIGTIRFCWSLSYWTSPLLLGILYRRGVGRCMNPDYMAFITVLANAQNVFNPQNRRLLSRYDFDFWASPVLYKWPDFNAYPRVSQFHRCRSTKINCYLTIRHPQRGGERAKLGTEDENQIDTMFVDKRGAGTEVGRTLVVCSEGNAGFYEIGAMETPLKMGYSYAIQKLGFTPDNIVVYAWSIGGYTATWAAMTYPDVKYMILDATFDEMMPLAKAKMPEFAQSLVKRTVDRYLNLNIAEQLVQDPTAIDTNRGNFLLMRLLKSRQRSTLKTMTLLTVRHYLRLSSTSHGHHPELYEV
ncbi:ABHGA-like protein [Mya arenaria]|uniref:ABHGA-like protein n=1 Tax=Mya arenaria TaxID=6604 RepID=A0ABY7GIN5_MYAAR|nr:ABHGA-like protein [Mya arenaria]